MRYKTILTGLAFLGVVVLIYAARATLFPWSAGQSAVPWNSPRTLSDLGVRVRLVSAKRVDEHHVDVRYVTEAIGGFVPRATARVSDASLVESNGSGPGNLLINESSPPDSSGSVSGTMRFGVQPDAQWLTIRPQIEVVSPERELKVAFQGLPPGKSSVVRKACGYEFIVHAVYVNAFLSTGHMSTHSFAGGGVRDVFVTGASGPRYMGIEVATDCPYAVLHNISPSMAAEGREKALYGRSMALDTEDRKGGYRKCVFIFPGTYPPPKTVDFGLHYTFPMALLGSRWVTFAKVPLTR